MKTFKALFIALGFALISVGSFAQTSIGHTPIEKIREDDPADRIQLKDAEKYSFVDREHAERNEFSWYELFFYRFRGFFL